MKNEIVRPKLGNIIGKGDLGIKGFEIQFQAEIEDLLEANHAPIVCWWEVPTLKNRNIFSEVGDCYELEDTIGALFALQKNLIDVTVTYLKMLAVKAEATKRKFVSLRLGYHKTYKNNSFIMINNSGVLNYYIDDCGTAEQDLVALKNAGADDKSVFTLNEKGAE